MQDAYTNRYLISSTNLSSKTANFISFSISWTVFDIKPYLSDYKGNTSMILNTDMWDVRSKM